MSDVDWSKRWDTSAYTSMGDVDWTKRNGVGSARQFGDDDGSVKDKRASSLYRTWLSKVNKPGIQRNKMSSIHWLSNVHYHCLIYHLSYFLFL